MAKVKTAVQQITAYLKGKGYDTSEIKGAFDELDAADVDLTTLAASVTDITAKNKEWVDWHAAVTPEIQAAMQERDALKAQIEKIKAAGFQVDTTVPDKTTVSGQYVTPEALDKFKQELAGASSSVMKSLTRISLKHYRDFNTEPDLDAVEKLMSEGKAVNVEDAYDKWSRPLYEERNKKTAQEEIDRKVKEGIQAELSKQGIRRPRKAASDNIDQAPLDKPAPSDKELRDAFLADLDSLADGVVAH